VIRGWGFGGDGPIALLHHANGMCAATWAPVAVGLQSNFRVVAIDACGHGDSEHLSVPQDYDWRFLVSDLYGVAEQLLDESGQSVISLGIGSSFGGIITAGTEGARPGLFERLMLLDPPIHPTQDLIDALGLGQEAEPPSRRDQLVTQTLRRRVQWPSREAARRAWRDKPLFAGWRDDAFDLYLDEGMADIPDGSVQLKYPPEVEAHIFRTTGSFGPLEYAPGVNIPECLVRAGRRFFPAEFLLRIAALFPQGDYLELSGGHMLPLKVPESVIEQVLQWRSR